MMCFSRIALFVLVSTVVSVGGDAWAVRDPNPLAIDQRIRTVLYNENEVFRFVGHYGYQSSIEFAHGESILTVSMGDSIAWQIVPSGTRLFLKPVEPDADTNMTIVTNLRTYHFELEARETEDIRDEDMVFVMRFVYPGTSQYVRGGGNDRIVAPDIEEDPYKYNFNYTLTGPQNISPVKIFDDGEFTYFEFPNKSATLPAFFLVESDNSESLINYRMVGDYVVVEQVGPRFTLRRGVDVVCVFNEAVYTPEGRTVVEEPAAPMAQK